MEDPPPKEDSCKESPLKNRKRKASEVLEPASDSNLDSAKRGRSLRNCRLRSKGTA